MDFYAKNAAALAYVREVRRQLGLTGESSCVESERPLRVYLAVDGHLAEHPDADVALLWTAGRGWAIAVEDGDVLVVVAWLPGAEPAPDVVARWARRLMSPGRVGGGVAQSA